MHYDVLGPVGARDGGAPLQLGGPMQRAVLGLLLVDPGRSLTADQILTEVWGDDVDDHTRASLYTYVSNLRGVLGKDRIARTQAGYRLVLAVGDEIDAVEFEHEVERGRELVDHDPASAAGLFGAALDRWYGRAYAGMDDLDVVRPEVARLHELRSAAQLDRVDALLLAGAPPPVAEIEQIALERPLDERARGLLMRSLYRAGRQADALRTFRDLRRLLRDELGIEPSRALVELDEQILLQNPALDREAGAASSNLPSFLTSFVGRDDDLARVADALRAHRLVTVTGPGGVGKTRLAVEVAAGLGRRFHDGVWLVDLAPVASPDSVAAAVASALQISVADPADPVSSLTTNLRSASTLIVLDNCEHLLDAAAAVTSAVLRASEALTILATSRSPLAVDSEFCIPLSGLSVSGEADRLGDAERLFLQRSESVAGRPDPSNAMGDVRSICEHLDGIPLALELAAARRDVLSNQEIAALLSRRFAVLVDQHQPRRIHRSLEATVGWSWGLLGPGQQRAFADLGVFEGPFTMAAAAAVMSEPGDVVDAIDTIEELVAASLVTVVDTDGQPTRYRLLETLRTYARDRLRESDRWAAAVQLHDRHYLGVCRASSDDFFGRGRVAATAAVAAEIAEFIAVWERTIANDPETALALAWPLGNYWLFEGLLAEGEMELRRVLDATAHDRSSERADALVIAAWIAVYRNDLATAISHTEAALATYREARDERRVAYALARAGHWAFATGDGARGVGLLQESLALCDEIGFEDGKPWPIVLLAQARRWSGDGSPEVREMFLDARRRFVEVGETYGQIHADMLLSASDEFPVEERARFAQEMVELSGRRGGENLMRPIALHNLAYPVDDLGEHERAAGLNQAAVRSAIATGATMNLGLALIQAATFANPDDEPERVTKLAGAGIAHFGMEMAPFQRLRLDPVVDEARKRLGDARFDELTLIGAAMSAEEAAEFALT